MASIEQTKSFLRDVFVDDYKQKAHLLRMVMGKGYGMKDFESVPFPGTTSQTYVNLGAPPAVPSMAAAASRGILPKLAAAALIGTAGAGLGAAVASYFSAAREADAQIRVFWGDTEITPGTPAEAVTE